MERSTKAPNPKRPIGNVGVLANLGNSSSSNNRSSRFGRSRRRNVGEARCESEDTDENELQLGLGGLYLESLKNPPQMPKSQHHQEKGTKKSKNYDRRCCKPRARQLKSLRGPKQLSNASTGLFAFASQRTTHNVDKTLSTRTEVMDESQDCPVRTVAASGYDAENEDKPRVANMRRQKHVDGRERKQKQAPGLFRMFSLDAKSGIEQHDDDMDWLCSRLDQHCSIRHGCKKRSAAPTHMLDSLCKRIDSKETPAKIETIGCLLTQNGYEATSDDASCANVGNDEQEPTVATEVQDGIFREQRSICDPFEQSINISENDATKVCDKKAPSEAKGNLEETQMLHNYAAVRFRPLLEPPGYTFRTSSTTKSDRYEEASKITSHENQQYIPNTQCSSSRNGWKRLASAERMVQSTGVDSSDEKDHGHIYTNQNIETLQLSPITLASPLLQAECFPSGGKVETTTLKLRRDGTGSPVASRELEQHRSGREDDVDTSMSSVEGFPSTTDGPSATKTSENCSNTDDKVSDIKTSKQEVGAEVEGVLRRSRRCRKPTDRLSIDLGGNLRTKNKNFEASSEESAASHTSTKANRKETVKIEHHTISSGKITAARRSKRALVPTAFFHKMSHSSGKGVKGKRDSKQRESEVDYSCKSTFEDDFLNDSSTETDDVHTDDSQPIGSYATCQKKEQCSNSLYFSSDSNEATDLAKPSRRCQGMKIANRKHAVLKNTVLGDDVTDDWSRLQLDQLHDAYNQIDPTSETFWQDVSQHVELKSALECQAKWFSLAETPCVKQKMQLTVDHGDDDIFDATPTRPKRLLLPSKLLHERIQEAATRQQAKPYSSSREIRDEEMKPTQYVRQGFKTYLQHMRRDVNRAEKAKMKTKSLKKKPIRQITDKDHQVNMRAKLTPGGTLDFRHDEDIDEWDEVMYDADEDEMDC